ncbi:TonB-dependent receptor [Anaerophaga thermohalophila]|uniref:TonB-dependent receptor n=1 Tax=Anaerophaga thermohalophila TaxID=177400 RepID=UPI00047469A8|nr:TonB-dependent receptor [Anaerophaga thermohalophila]
MKILLFISFLLQISLLINAQNGSISGRVIMPEKEKAPINIGIAGTNKGTITDKDGTYTIHNLKPGDYTIKASYVGYKPREVSVTVYSGEEIKAPDIIMEKTEREIAEIMVLGNHQSGYSVQQPSQSLRYNMPLLRMSQNIQIISKEVLADQQLTDMLESVSRNTSGAQMIEHWGTFARINMRGFKLPAFRNGMNVDLPWGPLTEDLSMVESIEFVKGPAGFMLSSGEPGGFYNVVTKKPKLLQTNEASIMMGSFNTIRATIDIGGNIRGNDKLLYRFNAMGAMKNTHRDYEFNDRYTINPSVTYLLNDQTSLTAEYIYQYSKLSVVGAAYAFAPDKMGSLPRDFTLAEPNIDPTDIREHNAFVTLQHRLADNWELTAQLGYLDYKLVGSSLWADSVSSEGLVYRSLSIWDAISNAKSGQAYIEGKVQTGSVGHHILTGVDMSTKSYYADWFQAGPLAGENNPLDIHNPVHNVPTSQMPVFDREISIRQRAFNGSYPAAQTLQSSAFYLQDELGFFADRLRLTLAGRYTHYTTSVYGDNTDDKVFTPRAGISFSIDENTSIYGLFDQSFLPEAGTDKEGNAFDPVKAKDIEAGIKRKWANGKWNSSITFYRITKENVLTSDPEDANYQVQLGEAQSEGIEFDLRGRILSRVDIILNYANTDVRITEDTNPDIVGTSLAGHAKHMTNGWLKYTFNASQLKGLGVGLGYQYQIDRSSWNWGADNKAILPDYFRLDGTISWEKKAIAIRLNINNLLDEYLYSGSGYENFYYWQTEPGINYRLSVNYEF